MTIDIVRNIQYYTLMAIASNEVRLLHAVGLRSLGVTIPPLFSKRMGLTKGSKVNVEDHIDYVIIRKTEEVPQVDKPQEDEAQYEGL